MKKVIYSLLIIFISAMLFAQETEEEEKPDNTNLGSEQRFLTSLNENPKDEAAYNGLLKLYNSQGRHKDRIKIALKAIQNLGDSDGLWTVIGDEYKILGDYSKSYVSYQYALKLAPTKSSTYNRMGLSLLKLENFHQAESAFKAAVFFSGDDSPVAKGVYLNNLGVCFEARNDYKSAAKYFKQALKYYPSYRKAQDNLDRVEAAMKDQG